MSGNTTSAENTNGKKFANILQIVSNQGFASNLPLSARRVSKAVKEKTNLSNEQRAPLLSAVNNLPSTLSHSKQNRFIATLNHYIEQEDKAKINQFLKGTFSTSMFGIEILSPEILDIPILGRTAGQRSTVLTTAVNLDDIETARRLLDLGANPNGEGLQYDATLAEQGRQSDDPYDLNTLAEPTTSRAAFNGNLPMLQLLVERGANINASGYGMYGYDAPLVTALECALYHLDRTKVGGRLKWGDPLLEENYAEDPSLFNKHIAIAKWCIDNGADVNLRGLEGRRPLRSAVEIAILRPDVIDIVQSLLTHGANPDRVEQNTAGVLITPRSIVEDRGSPELRALFNKSTGQSGGRRKRRAATTHRRRKGKKYTRKS